MKSYGSADAGDSENPQLHEEKSLQPRIFTDPALWLSVGLSFATGWVNAVFFVRYKAFASMLSGNMLLLAFSSALLIAGIHKSDLREPDSDWTTSLPPPALYICVITMSCMGAACCRALQKKRHWTASTFVPVILVGLVVFEASEYLLHGHVLHNKWHLLFFAMICGNMNSISLQGGVSMLPYCSTGMVMGLGHTLADMLIGQASAKDTRDAVKTVLVFAAVQLGAIGGMLLDKLTPWTWDFELAVIAPFIAVLLFIHDYIFKPSAELN